MFNHNHNSVNGGAEKIADDTTKSFEELGREVHHHAENAKSDMVKTLYDAAKTLRKQARDTGAPHEVVGHVDNVAEGFEKAASYLKHNSYADIGEDAVHKAKNNPVQTMAIFLVIGVIIGLLLRGSSSSHDHR
jgi:ElaB/YqjD/DUF883 family membrane-anchored ribosome-binding protein